MTDDIVTRLRRVPERVPKGMGIVGLNEYYQRCQDAADEIERLRKAGDQLAYWALQENLAGELISAAKAWKAVRGE